MPLDVCPGAQHLRATREREPGRLPPRTGYRHPSGHSHHLATGPSMSVDERDDRCPECRRPYGCNCAQGEPTKGPIPG